MIHPPAQPNSHAPISSGDRAAGRRGLRVGLAIGLCLGVGLAALASMVSPAPANARHVGLERKAFDQALTTLLDQHVDPTDEHEILTAALKAAVSTLDRHSTYVSHAERQQTKAKGTNGSSGMFVNFKRPAANLAATVRVSAVDPDSPAARAGVQAGDQLLTINGHDTAFLSSHSEVERELAGRPGTRLQLVVAKPAKAAEQVTLELAPTSPTSVTGRLLTTGNEQVAVITIRAFRPGTGEQFKRQLQTLTTKAGGALAGIVLDLRNNPGGEVSEAVIIADAFISKGLIVRTRGRSGRIMREEQAHATATDTQTPIVVVQNRFSASASELLTIALQDHGRAKVIGEKSFGKGTIQQVQGLPDGSLLTLTIARYYSPRDHRIDGRGVTPDVLAAEQPGKPDAWLTQAISMLGSSG